MTFEDVAVYFTQAVGQPAACAEDLVPDVMLENYAHVASLGKTLSEPRCLRGDSGNS